MKVQSLLALIAVATLLGACSSQLRWTNNNGSSPDESELQEARKTCRIDRKLKALENADSDKNSQLRKANSNAAKMQLKDDFEEVRKQVYREIDTCMSKQGYKR